jgi:hypothetical protein
MSQVIDLCEDSDDDNGECPNTASVPSPPLSRKSDAHFRNESSGRGGKTATGSAEFAADLELADEVEAASPHQKRRVTGNCAHILKGVHDTEKDIGGEDTQVHVEDRRESHDVFATAAAASHPMNADSEQTSRDDGSVHKNSWKPSTSKPASIASGRQWKESTWEDRLSELADYRKIYGNCNVPTNYSGNYKLGTWVATQRYQYRLHREAKRSFMTLSRIQTLESLGFVWDSHGATWEGQFRELADYRKIHGHCDVPTRCKENTKLSEWVATQRRNYRWHMEGKRSAAITIFRIKELESLGFEWKLYNSWMHEKPQKPRLDVGTTLAREKAMEALVHMQRRSLEKVSPVKTSAAIKLASLSNPKNPTRMAKSAATSSRVESKNRKRVEAGDARFEETDLDSSPSELAAKPSLYSKRQAAKSLSPDKSAPAGDSEESNTRKDSIQTKPPWLAHQQKSIASFSHVLLVAGPPEDSSLVAAKKPSNSIQGAESHLETAPSNELLRANPMAIEPLQQMRNMFTHAFLLGDGSTRYCVQPTRDKLANTPQVMEHTFHVEDFQSDNVLNEIELELIWLGEESMYCLSCPEFQFDFIYEYASPALKLELRKLSRDDHNETEKLKQIVRLEDWMVSRRFDFVRNYIRMMIGRGFRRQRMRIVIAELRLLRRQQTERHFPAMILERGETVPVKASAVIEQVDVNTLKVVATFPSRSEAEQQTGIPRANISRGMHQGRPVGGYFWRAVRLHSS